MGFIVCIQKRCSNSIEGLEVKSYTEVFMEWWLQSSHRHPNGYRWIFWDRWSYFVQLNQDILVKCFIWKARNLWHFIYFPYDRILVPISRDSLERMANNFEQIIQSSESIQLKVLQNSSFPCSKTNQFLVKNSTTQQWWFIHLYAIEHWANILQRGRFT